MTETNVNIPTIDITIEMGRGNERDAWFTASIPLEGDNKEYIRFRASTADKEMIATSVCNLLQRWAGAKDD